MSVLDPMPPRHGAVEAPRAIWEANIQDELVFWQRILSGTHEMKEWCDRAQYVLTGRVPIYYDRFEPISSFIDDFPERLIDIVNVGSGPCVPLQVTHPSRHIRMLNVDPLGDHYSRMIVEAGYKDHAEILPLAAETLGETLPRDHFHIAWSRNALDHAWDPLLSIRNMVKITRPGGKIIVKVLIDEGRHAGYGGLHRWNFRPTAAGECELWNPEQTFNINRELDGDVSHIAVTTLPERFMLMVMTRK